jgi:hypothetical protein
MINLFNIYLPWKRFPPSSAAAITRAMLRILARLSRADEMQATCCSKRQSNRFTFFSFQIPQTTASERAFATINMLRFDFSRAALQIRLLPQISAQFSRMPSRAKIQDSNAPYLLYQRPLANRAFSSFIQSDNSTLDNDSRRKWKKLLEPSQFDSAVTFEEAFGQKVVT